MTYHFSEDVLARNPHLRELLPTSETTAGKGTSPSKYGNARTEMAGMSFASGKEAARVNVLILMEKMQQIWGLRLQVPYELYAGVIYKADAVYCELQNGKLQVVVEDAKGFRNRTYLNKKKQFEHKYGIKIREV